MRESCQWRGEPWKRISGKEGKSGTARAAAVNVVRTISTIIRRLIFAETRGIRTISNSPSRHLPRVDSYRRSLDRNWRPTERTCSRMREREKREERESERNSYDASHDFFFFLFVFLFTRDCLDASCYILHRSQSVLVEADFRPPLPSPILPPSSVIAIAVATHNGDRTCCVSPFECVRIEGANFSARTEHRIRSRGYYTATVLLDER